jgi:inhibitor of cysteine peptidase
MKRSFLFILSVLLSTAALTACGGKTLKASEEINGSTIDLKKGQTLTISIDGNPTTGYNWEIETVDQNILQSAGDPDYKSDSMLVGSGGTFKFKFTAINPGTATLKLKYWRSFEPENPPVETFEVTVNVKE